MLTKGMFGGEFEPAQPRFGIQSGQIHRRGYSATMPWYVHNAGWYNRQGEKLGWGDLLAADLQRISDELADDELFIVLSEHDSFHKFVRQWGIIGSLCDVDHEQEGTPGQEYVAEHAMIIVQKGRIWRVPYYGEPIDGYRDVDGVHFYELSRNAAKELITG